MASPIPFQTPEKEAPFDVTQIRKIITDLLIHTTDEVESVELEIKSWCRDERELAEKVAEACACIANTAGGLVLVGVNDGANTWRRFSSCPHSMVNTSWLQTNVHNLTRPSVELVPFDASAVLTEILGCTGNNLYVLRVPRSRYISGHVTHKGVSKIRIGKECQPQYIAEDDRTSAVMSDIRLDDLSEASIEWGMAQHRKRFKTFATWASQREFLEQERLVRRYLPDEDNEAQSQVSFAALLLFGSASAIERRVPFLRR